MKIYPKRELLNIHYRPEGAAAIGTVILGVGKRLVRTYWIKDEVVYMRDNIFNVITREVIDAEHIRLIEKTFECGGAK